jgi:hypothetical protein
MNKLLASSSDPKQLSLTVRGVLVAVVPLVAVVIRAAGGELDDSQVQAIIDGVSEAVFLLGSAVSAVMMVAGLVRKAYNTFSQ